jgi:hypothetical protein
LHSSLPPERPIDLAHDIGRGEADIAQHSAVEPSEQRAVASALPPQTDQTHRRGDPAIAVRPSEMPLLFFDPGCAGDRQ